ncbi:hypothetical protein [Aquimarina algiphila]|uniref:Uncharacterized protein n=1 Tax=Aquimarina algiphila TaxID=2047982 RepID=A0A554VBQ9_9FLAO|nr:hypothetical protein [Aquimarina algiphila]TSE04003.1 hypothetical protein FOF46_27840 [Aquimarina algiphila]
MKVELENIRLFANQQNSLIAHSDSEMELSILCFTQPPRPPELKPCDECGKFPLISGKKFFFNASPSIFEKKKGHMKLIIQNQSGDVWQRKINIEPPMLA